MFDKWATFMSVRNVSLIGNYTIQNFLATMNTQKMATQLHNFIF